ncbi:MAG: tripartite tricarboxylate transporter substrate binding protein [Alphaproteobacteria bacterium]|nr:tripartite tricarboxylate transporter substrate binding protein [Alphaproteobacteria bacterium]
MVAVCKWLTALVFVAFGAVAAGAQSYPTKPVRIIVPTSPGGITDALARALAQRLTETLGQTVIVENRPAGAGHIGMDFVAKSAPDGYTLMVNSDAAFVVNPHLYSKLSYDPINDFAPISGLGISPQALTVHPSVPANTFSELVAYAKTKPGALNYGTFGIGTSGHLNIIHLESETGTKFTPVHYRGAAPAITDLLGGHIQMIIVAIGLTRQNIEAGKLKALGIGSLQRLPQYPNLPTLHESGLPNFEAGSWYGFVAPKGTPREIVEKLSAETQKIFGDQASRDKFLAPAVTFSIASPPEQFAERMRADLAKWGKVIKEAGIRIE